MLLGLPGLRLALPPQPRLRNDLNAYELSGTIVTVTTG
jgi:hypothetical protein